MVMGGVRVFLIVGSSVARGVFVLLEHLVDVLCVAGTWSVGRRCVLCRGLVVGRWRVW